MLTPGSHTYESIALEIGIDARTLARWRHNPAFKSAFGQAKRELYEQNLAGLASLSGVAISKLKTILDDDKTTVRERLYAIRIILNAAQNASAMDIENLIDRLEEGLRSLEAVNT